MAGRRNKLQRDRLTIPEFYEDRSVFVTGATGFMGKVLLEKLLRSCPRVKNIYILLRAKKGKNIEERLQEMIDLPMFVRVKRQDPTQFQKIIPMSGDVMELGLGLSAEDRQTLINEVSVVFHIAASVRFDDKLKHAVIMNLRGTHETVKLALEMPKVESFMHVSTTYCVKHRPVIEEKVYPAIDDWRAILGLVEKSDEHLLEVMTPKLLGFYPNTYTYSKALAEHVIVDHADQLPMIIFRPSIVISSMTEPLPGWVDNFNGPVGLIVASGKGIVRTVFSDPNTRPDFIPCDLATKGMIVASWHRATTREPIEKVFVCNAANSDVKSITQQELVELGHYISTEVPLNNVLWLPGGNVTKCRSYYYLQVFLFHLIPALIIDSLLQMYGKPPLLGKVQRKIFLANTSLEYFLLRQWKFLNNKLIALDRELFPEDVEAFKYYHDDVDLVEYFRNCTYGGRQFLMKEDISTLDDAKKHYNRMWWVDRVTKVVFLLLVARLAYAWNVIPYLRMLLTSFFLYFYNAFQ